MSKATNEALRAKYVEFITKLLADAGEEVLMVKSNEMAIPCIDGEGNDNYIVVTVKVPTGTRDGTPYDGYGEAESYKVECKMKAEKKAEADAAKAKKIARDKAYREKQAALKAEREARGE
jgi:hypothetical protein